jgi:hypothetical protein
MTEKKIIARVFGGIGNQLFIYAAARRLSLKSNSILVLDVISGFENDISYKRTFQLNNFTIKCRYATNNEMLKPFSKLRRFILRSFNLILPLKYKTYYVQNGVDFDNRLLNITPRKYLYTEGYWQSEAYFKDFESIIRTELKIIPPKDQTNLDLASKIVNHESVSIHFRYFDNANQSNKNNNISINYYLKAISFIEDINPNVHYFIFSDDPIAVYNLLSIPEDKVTYVSNNIGDENAFADLWLMSLCKHFIIANSTFSWWGAWLSNNHNKIVISPKANLNLDKNVTAWGFEGLIPSSWIQI